MTLIGKLTVIIIFLSIGLIVSISVTLAVCMEYKKERKRIELLKDLEELNGKEVSG